MATMTRQGCPGQQSEKRLDALIAEGSILFGKGRRRLAGTGIGAIVRTIIGDPVSRKDRQPSFNHAQVFQDLNLAAGIIWGWTEKL